MCVRCVCGLGRLLTAVTGCQPHFAASASARPNPSRPQCLPFSLQPATTVLAGPRWQLGVRFRWGNGSGGGELWAWRVCGLCLSPPPPLDGFRSLSIHALRSAPPQAVLSGRTASDFYRIFAPPPAAYLQRTQQVGQIVGRVPYSRIGPWSVNIYPEEVLHIQGSFSFLVLCSKQVHVQANGVAGQIRPPPFSPPPPPPEPPEYLQV